MAKKRKPNNPSNRASNPDSPSTSDAEGKDKLDGGGESAPPATDLNAGDVAADTADELARRYGPDADADEDGPAETEEAVEADGNSGTADDHGADAAEEAEPAAAVPPPVKVKSGRGLAWFSLLLALASLGGAGYLYYELIHQQPMAKLSNDISSKVDAAVASVRGGESASEAKFAELRESLASLKAQQDAALKSLANDQAQRLANTEQGLMASLNKVANATPPSEQQWKLAELEYLLRIANHRVLMESDTDGALQVLSTADAILQELDDFGLHEVRAQLADEMLSLKQVRAPDLQGLFLRLEALKRQLAKLPMRLPEFKQTATGDSASAAEEAGGTGALAALRNKMSEYVQFRRLETPAKPLLGPNETMYLELNLRLMLERAQLAALRQQQEVYAQSLSSAQEWLEQYLDPESAQVESLVDEIDSLLELDLTRQLPDISGSLRTLLATERGTS